MKGNFRHYFYCHPACFQKEMCDFVKDLSKDIPFEKGGIGGTESDARRSDIKWLPVHSPIGETIMGLARDVNKHFNLDLSNVESLQYTEYDSKVLGHYDFHADVDFFLGETLFDRKLSITVQLSNPEDYEGGDFVIMGREGEVHLPKEAKKMGTVIAFPSYINHKVSPVTRGLRKSLVSWVVGPRWR